MKKLIIIPVLVVFSIDTFSQILYVPQEYATIQAGIDAAVEGDTVIIDEGTYIENIEINRSYIVVGSKYLTTGDTSYISKTIIDGGQNGTVVFFKPGESFNTEFAGFTVTNGNTPGAGGGIFIAGSTPVLHHLKVISNTAANGGGISSSSLSDLHLSHSIISNNTATQRGAGIQSMTSNLDIRNCIIKANMLTGGQGGAIHFSVGPGPEQMPGATIDSTIIAYNTGMGTASSAGAYFGKSNDLPVVNVTLTNSQFIGNSCIGNTALRMHGQLMEFDIINCTFIGNEAEQYGGGAVFTGGSSGNVINCIFASNQAATGGGEFNSGGVTVWGSEVDFFNCSFIENSAFYGTAMTIGAGDVSLANCIVWDNSNDHIALVDINETGSTLSVSYSDIQDGQGSVSTMTFSGVTWGEGNIDSDPLFPGDGDHPYSLGIGSPCIDAGTPDTESLPSMPTDILGNNRIWDGDGDETAVIDMGPYEYGSILVGINQNVNILNNQMDMHSYPNPSYGSTTIEYALEKPGKVTFVVYDHMGRMIYKLTERQQQGIQHTVWNDRNLPAGLYYVILQSGVQFTAKKFIMIK